MSLLREKLPCLCSRLSNLTMSLRSRTAKKRENIESLWKAYSENKPSFCNIIKGSPKSRSRYRCSFPHIKNLLKKSFLGQHLMKKYPISRGKKLFIIIGISKFMLISHMGDEFGISEKRDFTKSIHRFYVIPAQEFWVIKKIRNLK